jgi:hypothetical protein
MDNMSKGCKTGREQEESPLTAEKIHEHGKHPNSLANLKRYEKGVSGNPGGRTTKYQKLGEALKPIGKEHRKEDQWDGNDWQKVSKKHSYKQEVLYGIWDKAIKGDIKCIELLARLGCLDEK